MKENNFIFQGEEYIYLSEQLHTLKDGTKVQITDYRVEEENGVIRYPYMICEVPDGYDRIDISKLSSSCIQRFSEGIVKLKESELKNQ